MSRLLVDESTNVELGLGDNIRLGASNGYSIKLVIFLEDAA